MCYFIYVVPVVIAFMNISSANAFRWMTQGPTINIDSGDGLVS